MSLNPALAREYSSLFVSARLKGFGVPGGGADICIRLLIILVAKLIIGTLGASAQTAAANRPPDLSELCILLNAASRFGNSISPQRHSAASNDEFARSKFSASLSLNSIISRNPMDAALCFAMANIWVERSVAKTWPPVLTTFAAVIAGS